MAKGSLRGWFVFQFAALPDDGNSGLATISGGYRRGATPVPIPKTEVKPSTGDGTYGAVRRESSKPPDFFIQKTRAGLNRLGFFACAPGRAHLLEGESPLQAR
jgi:hypothetical protein